MKNRNKIASKLFALMSYELEASVKLAFALILTLLLAACTTFNGKDLVPGKSTAAEAETMMGTADQRLKLANGDSALYFSRLPYGRAMYVVTVGPTGGSTATALRRTTALSGCSFPTTAWCGKCSTC